MAVVMAMAQPSQHTQGAATLLNTLISTRSLSAAAKAAITKVWAAPIAYQDHLACLPVLSVHMSSPSKPMQCTCPGRDS